ncbi:3-hydroxybutyryl-CoA dehydrogenase [Meiothermus taiwanensis]|jgi:3-hydroxybutyryl-CoA dehydrogenase|uniref:3-hydroxybutyryl-CoA dehydrogenase n=2 Tax=Meiothermus taiwanensis TaxID=172827 RepID=A0ABN5M574_9DEIN|nr:3-hydroxybutyryl-CoA dehydrogenase [Meiothermus taiwanensis]AWR87665.1 3-hydroxybutyryl-CoA dehydrogenase [Meiothermus taiwanensis WR-220]KIQ53762.1 3-hydroxybutyryl-CoA dehydrogenase [Meiothermus taiwanensis]KZK15654.1 3-hydroxybutyryl-CoA dehydrogenase [Meiothermus taiwanensis]RIH78782.1 putative 3-hydroxybutyryl-CoA dehydrogenase [Meiothermus taiwanensis]
MEIRKIGVVGAGQMGAGIAQVAAQAGYQVVLRDLEQTFLERGLGSIRRSIGKLLEKGKLDQQAHDGALARITTTTQLSDLADCDLVIEAIVEHEPAKLELFRELDALVQPAAILASNTSSIPITRLASATRRPERFIGMHFMNPVPLMELVEVIRGYLTDEATTQTVLQVARRMGKTPVEVNDYPGFVSNRILLPMLNEAIQCVMEGVATPEAIDQVMKLGMNHPMGPLTLADFIGLDTCLSIMEVLHRGLGDDKYRPSPLLRKMVQAGLLGRKSGRGFYRYDEKGNKIG